MKTHLANYQERIGGGWTQARYLHDSLAGASYEEADIYLIAGPTQTDIQSVDQAKRDGKKIVLRLDNMPRNSRNKRQAGVRNTKAFCELADLVIYQSEWAKKFLYPFTKKDGPVILNGVDTEIYNDKDRNTPADSYLYARSSRDEGKNWIGAWYWFVNNTGTLDIVGKFSGENVEHNFDFYNGERFKFYGEQPSLLPFYNKNRYFLYSFISDACSNTLLEARACGMEIVDVFGALKTGGAPEIMACEDLSKERMLKQYKEVLCEL